MLGVIASHSAVKGLRADIEIMAGKPSLVTMGVIVIKPFQSLPGFL